MDVRRVKRYHSKARSGCFTCRRRRVKCDEGKPICSRCKRAKQECLGYGNSAASRLVGDHWLSTAESDYGSTQEQFDDTVTMYGSNDASDVVFVGDKGASIHRYVSYGLESLEEQRSVQFWLEITGPNMETYGPIGGLYTILLPQWAHHCGMIKHFMVATALTHEKLFLTAFERPIGLAYRPFHHFQLGIQSLIREQHSKLSRILGSIIAWTFEMMMGNFPAARFHVAASIRLANDLEAEASQSNDWSSFNSLQYQIKPGLRLMDSYSAAAFDEGNQQISYQERGSRANSKIQFLSLDDARNILSQEIERYCSHGLATNQATREYRCFVTAWHLALREYHRAHSETLEQHKATLFLFSVAMALLPANEVGDMSYSANPAIIWHVLTNVDGLLHQISQHKSSHVKAAVEITLKTVLEIILWNFRDGSIQQRAIQLLSRIEVNESLLLDNAPEWRPPSKVSPNVLVRN